MNVTKNALIFHSQGPTYDSFTFDSQFLHELKHKVFLSKSVSGVFHFDSVSLLFSF